MQLTTLVLEQIKNSYPQFSFKKGEKFLWSSSDNTIYYGSLAADGVVSLLHELSHALLGHSCYSQDVQLITMERQAWDYTLKLAPAYGITITDEIIQSNLDSYRDWLHARSTCPNCSANGLQTNKFIYKCPVCNNSWRVNEARTCALRRYKMQ